MARPTKYSKEYNDQVYKLCLLGAIDKDIADFFNVSERTINRWKESEPEFCQSLKRGKAEADAVIAEKLFERAKGYEHKEDKIFLHEGKPVIVPTVKRYTPDTTAAIFWLKNRQPEKWKDKQEIDHTTKGDKIESVDYSKLSKEALREIINSQKSE